MSNQERLIFCAFFLSILLLGSVSATNPSLGTFQKDTEIELLQVCSNGTSLCDSCNISSVKYPNSSILVSNVEMTPRIADFNYSIHKNYTSITGEYSVNGFCMSGGGLEVFSYDFDVTVNGNEAPEGSVVVLFLILFLILIGGLLSLLMYNIFHLIQWDFDAKDLIWNISAYFILFAVYILGKEYLGNSFVDDFLVWVIGVGALTNVILPIIAFVISYIKMGLESNQ